MPKQLKTAQIRKQFYGETVQEFQASLLDMQKDATENGGDPDTFTYETEVDDDYGCHNANLVLEYKRPETDKEMRDREQKVTDAQRRLSDYLRQMAARAGFDLVPRNKP